VAEKLRRQPALERAMKVQEVIMRAMAKKITWWQAAEIGNKYTNDHLHSPVGCDFDVRWF